MENNFFTPDFLKLVLMLFQNPATAFIMWLLFALVAFWVLAKFMRALAALVKAFK